MAEQEPPSGRGADETGASNEIRAFLIADVRGYTLFTQERGDEAAAKLARRFAWASASGTRTKESATS